MLKMFLKLLLMLSLINKLYFVFFWNIFGSNNKHLCFNMFEWLLCR